METRKDEGFWKQVNEKIRKFIKDLEKDSVAKNPRKPVDCCNPPVAPKLKHKLKI